MSLKVAVTAIGLTVLLTGSANALTLKNEDTSMQEVVIVASQGDGEVTTITLDTGETMENLCMQGCTMQLANGLVQTFAGDENVSIVDGDFLIVE